MPRPSKNVAPPAPHQSTQRRRRRRDWIDNRALSARLGDIEAETGADVGVAVKPLEGRAAVVLGPLQSDSAWSTMKVPVILARFRLAEGDDAALEGRVADAIRESDNEAAESLFDEIVAAKGGVVPASAYVQQGLEMAGDDSTVVNTVPPPGGFSTYGQTRWALSDGLLFYSALAQGCLTPASGVATILRRMGEIEPSQSWGLGQAKFSGAREVLFKGGWGPDPAGRYLVRQFGIVEAGDGGLAVGLIDEPADGQFESGVEVLDRLADAVADNTDPSRAPIGPC